MEQREIKLTRSLVLMLGGEGGRPMAESGRLRFTALATVTGPDKAEFISLGLPSLPFTNLRSSSPGKRQSFMSHQETLASQRLLQEHSNESHKPFHW